jgi:hypothetical protein
MTTIVKLDGGIGNQLFQLAFARSRASLTGQPTLLDISDKKSSSERPLIPWLKTEKEFFKIVEIKRKQLVKPHRKILGSWNQTRFLSFELNQKNSREMVLPIFMEDYRQFVYDFLLSSCGYFMGTFASHYYWHKIEILPMLKWIENELINFSQFSERAQCFGIGLHARRGDYVSNPKTRAFHGYCDLDYFQRALDLLASRGYASKGILISSDDSEFARELLTLALRYSSNVKIASSNPYIALLELNSCKTSIGSNSTFSFWASYLTKKDVRLFPKNWFRKQKHPFQLDAILMDNFITIDNFLL